MEYLKLLDISVSIDSVAQNNGLQDTMQNSTSMDVKYSEENGSDVALGNMQNGMVSQDLMNASEHFDDQDGSGVSSGWKIVMHEESQLYYYWNVETEETSWEVPQVLIQADHLTNDPLPPASVTHTCFIFHESKPYSTNWADLHPEFCYKTEFQSHEPEFDYLKSLEIEEKINRTKWCQTANRAVFLLSTNDKTIKFWKDQEKKVKKVSDMNIDPSKEWKWIYPKFKQFLYP
ncbi:hypothetical protein KIW84_076698 [Lathyrus oleraceus]|uniref:WW domain-containing protein n=1 Tax=Pisum sativum TaxID=3888 RepID=A0A9D4VX91_PEA|nr:hypothetical protein KIW84_076698 [Pisum sativum]